jgi:hypothetical protein
MEMEMEKNTSKRIEPEAFKSKRGAGMLANIERYEGRLTTTRIL